MTKKMSRETGSTFGKKKLIIANWKLNPTTLKDAQKLAASIERVKKNTVVLCPPTIYLSQINYPNLGAQDCFWAEKGPHTGQVSPAQLKDLKIKYALVGHSERRAIGETDEMINTKVKACIEFQIMPVLCIGFGTGVEQDDLEVIDVLKEQLKVGLKNIEPGKVVVAYEPVWAIGTGKTATPEHAEKVGIYVKSKFGVSKVLYGGSVNPVNAKAFLSQVNIDGLLVGGASLVANQFNSIIKIYL